MGWDGMGRDLYEMGRDRDPGLLQGEVDHRVDRLQVGPGRLFWDDAAEALVEVGLAGQQVRSHRAAVLDHRHRGLVAGGLDTQDAHALEEVLQSGRIPSGTWLMIESSCSWYWRLRTSSTHMTTASSPVSW